MVVPPVTPAGVLFALAPPAVTPPPALPVVLCCARTVWVILVTDKRSPDSNAALSNMPAIRVAAIAFNLLPSFFLIRLPISIIGLINDIVNGIALNNFHSLNNIEPNKKKNLLYLASRHV
jgi:hypothetical protein